MPSSRSEEPKTKVYRGSFTEGEKGDTIWRVFQAKVEDMPLALSVPCPARSAKQVVDLITAIERSGDKVDKVDSEAEAIRLQAERISQLSLTGVRAGAQSFDLTDFRADGSMLPRDRRDDRRRARRDERPGRRGRPVVSHSY